VLVNNHDPRHLREELERDYPGEFGWDYLQRGPERWEIRIARLASTLLPRILCDTHETATGQLAPDASGAVWKLQMSRRHLDANVIRLQPGSRIEAHAGPEFDVLLHILHGDGLLLTEVGRLALRPGGLLWLPRLSRREIVAGEQGLIYLTVHTRRAGLSIQQAPQRA
jgi:quercetin dioxygenase-like cupin family protein